MELNRGRVWIGGIAGGAAWVIWSFLMNLWVAGRYVEVQGTGMVME
jgi:hypothetical protein